MNIIKQDVITDAEAKKIMEERSELEDMKFEQENANISLNKFIKISDVESEEMKKKLFKISKLKDVDIVTIINFLPKDKDDLRAILHKNFNSLTEDECNLILETVKN